MSGPSEWSVAAGVLADAGLKATVVLGLGWAATRLLGRASAAQRHAIWAVTFAVLPVLPCIAAQRGADVALSAPVLVGVWMAGVVAFGAALVRGLVGLSVLRRSARPDPTTPGVFTSDAVRSPVTWGVFRPIVVFPPDAAGWSASRRAAALAHERAHVARRDWLVHLLTWSVCVLFWFHPLVWVARRQLIREAEHAADDIVLAQGVRPSTYASLLVALSRPSASIALGAGSLVGHRVHAVLGDRSRSARRWPSIVGALVLAGLVVPFVGGWATWSAPPDAPLTCLPAP